MRFGTSISLKNEDVEKLNYIAEVNNYNQEMHGITGLIRLTIKIAYAHLMEMSINNNEKTGKIDTGEKPILPVGGISQKSQTQKKMLW